MKNAMLTRETMEASRPDFVRILGEPAVAEAERMPEDRYTERKWDRLPELLRACGKFHDAPVFEARRSFLLGLDAELRGLLVRHLLEEARNPIL